MTEFVDLPSNPDLHRENPGNPTLTATSCASLVGLGLAFVPEAPIRVTPLKLQAEQSSRYSTGGSPS